MMLSFKEWLYEMAYHKKDWEIRMSGISDVLLRHFILVSIYPKHPAYAHWNTEIAAYEQTIKSTSRLKPKNRKPNKSQFWDIFVDTYVNPLSILENEIRVVVRKYGTPAIPKSTKMISAEWKSYIDSLSTEMNLR